MERPEDGIQPKSTGIHHLILVLVLAIAAFVQLTTVSRTTVISPLHADAADYFSYAWNLRDYGTYSSARTWPPMTHPESIAPDKLRSPGYPLFLLAVGKPSPDRAFLLRVEFVQAGLGILTVLLVYLLGARFLERGPALAAAALTAISPHLAVMSTYILTESLFTLLLVASLYALVAAVQSGRRSLFVATGLLWGVCSLVRPTAQFFPVLLLAYALAMPSLRRFAGSALLAFACFVAVLAPWLIRNQSPALAHPTVSLMVNTLAHGSYPDFKYQGRPETYGYPYRFDPGIKSITKDLPSVLGYIEGRFRAEPRRYLSWYLYGKPRTFLSWENVEGFDVLLYPVSRTPMYQDRSIIALRMLSYYLHWPLMLLALGTSIALLVRRVRRALPLKEAIAACIGAGLFLYGIAFHMVAASFPRYAIPFRPLAYALAMYGIVLAWRGFQRGSAAPGTEAAALSRARQL